MDDAAAEPGARRGAVLIMGMVRLNCGRQVRSDSEEWRAECEARFLLNIQAGPARDGAGREFRASAKRRRLDYLAGVERKRGIDSRRALESHAMALWSSGYRGRE